MKTRQSLTWSMVLIAFAAVGLLFGWLIGSSNSPVVAGALPLMFGLIGGFSFQYLERQAKENLYIQELNKLPLDEKTKNIVTDTLNSKVKTPWLPALWALLIVVFCIASYKGILEGVNYRLGDTRTLNQVINKTKLSKDSISPEDWILLQNALFRLRSLNSSKQEIDELFIYGLSPILSRDKSEIDYVNKLSLEFAVDYLFKGIKIKERPSRGPASVSGPVELK